MPRKRKSTSMELISKKKARAAVFEKRKKSLKKSAEELSTLCGVSVGMIVVSDEGRSEAEVWPPGPDPVARMIELYKTGLGQDGMRNSRIYGVGEYFKERREKVEEEMKKMREERYAKCEEEYCKGLSEDQWRELGGFLKAKIGAVREKITSVLMQQQQQWSRTLIQERVPDFIQDQNGGDLVAGLRNPPYLESELEESEIYAPERASSSCSEGEGIDNYTYFLNDKCYQNYWGMQTEMVEPLMPNYDDMPNELLQNWQGLMQTEMMEKVDIDIGEFEALMSYDMPNQEMRVQNWEGLMSMSALPEMQTTQEGYYVGN